MTYEIKKEERFDLLVTQTSTHSPHMKIIYEGIRTGQHTYAVKSYTIEIEKEKTLHFLVPQTSAHDFLCKWTTMSAHNRKMLHC